MYMIKCALQWYITLGAGDFSFAVFDFCYIKVSRSPLDRGFGIRPTPEINSAAREKNLWYSG